MKNLRWQSTIAIFALILASANASASIITSTDNGSGGGGLFVLNSSVTTPSPANLLGGSLAYPNTLYYNETFNPNPNYTEGSAFYRFPSAGPATGYAVTLDVQNTGAQAWSGYTLYCGDLSISDPSYLSWITFDQGFTPTIEGGGPSATWASANNNWIVWSGLNVPVNSSIQLKFNLDLIAGMFGGWQIDQEPQVVAVPEPSSMSMAMLGLLGLGIVGLIRRRCHC